MKVCIAGKGGTGDYGREKEYVYIVDYWTENGAYGIIRGKSG